MEQTHSTHLQAELRLDSFLCDRWTCQLIPTLRMLFDKPLDDGPDQPVNSFEHQFPEADDWQLVLLAWDRPANPAGPGKRDFVRTT